MAGVLFGTVRRRWWLRPMAVGLLTLAAAILTAREADSQSPRLLYAGAVLRNVDGADVGVVQLMQAGSAVHVFVLARDLPPGFHGFHIHAVGTCDASGAFASAGGHLNLGGHSHAQHAGDMPPLYVMSDGTAETQFRTDRFALSDLFGSERSAIIIHADPDNFANIPSRYASEPDAMTLATGDSGPRIACGVIQRPG